MIIHPCLKNTIKTDYWVFGFGGSLPEKMLAIQVVTHAVP
jgi:hypothetical protein